MSAPKFMVDRIYTRDGPNDKRMCFQRHAEIQAAERPGCGGGLRPVRRAGLTLFRNRDGLADGRLPALEGGAGDDEAAPITEIGNRSVLQHSVNGLLANSQSPG